MLNLEKLIAIEEIKQLKARYFRLNDTKQWDLMRTVFADDIVCDFVGVATDPETGVDHAPEISEVLRGVDAVMTTLITFGNGVTAIHHGHMPEIEITGENSATGIWAMRDNVFFTTGGEPRKLIGSGHYVETYERVNGEWKIKTLRLPRIRVEVL